MIGPAFDSVLAAARGGDEAAFAALWRDLNPGLLRYLQVVAPAWAEDVASEVWLEVTVGLGRFSGPESGFRPYRPTPPGMPPGGRCCRCPSRRWPIGPARTTRRTRRSNGCPPRRRWACWRNCRRTRR